MTHKTFKDKLSTKRLFKIPVLFLSWSVNTLSTFTDFSKQYFLTFANNTSNKISLSYSKKFTKKKKYIKEKKFT